MLRSECGVAAVTGGWVSRGHPDCQWSCAACAVQVIITKYES